MKRLAMAMMAAVAAGMALGAEPVKVKPDDGGKAKADERPMAPTAAGPGRMSPQTAKLYERVFGVAEKLGKPVLILYSFPTTCPICINNRNYVLVHPQTREARARFVTMEIPYDQGDDRYHGYRGKFPGNYIPFWVITTPEGEFLDGGDGTTIGAPNMAWLRRVLEVAAKHPPVPKKSQDAAAKMLQEAREDLKNEEYAQVHAACYKLRRLWYPKNLAAELEAVKTELAETGSTRLTEADALAGEKKHLDAALAYDKTARQFGSVNEHGKQARQKLDALLKAQPEACKEFRALQRKAEAEELLAKAKRAEAKNPTAARAVYKAIVQQYAETPCAAEARAAAERLGAALPIASAEPKPDAAPKPKPAAAPPAGSAKPAPGEGADEKQAQNLIRLARTFRSAGMNAKAKEKLRACMEQYPKTKAAHEAELLLIEWGLD